MGASTAIEEVAQPLGLGKRLVGAPNPDRVGTDDDRHLPPMAGDGDLLASDHTVEDLWQSSSSFTDRHR